MHAIGITKKEVFLEICTKFDVTRLHCSDNFVDEEILS